MASCRLISLHPAFRSHPRFQEAPSISKEASDKPTYALVVASSPSRPAQNNTQSTPKILLNSIPDNRLKDTSSTTFKEIVNTSDPENIMVINFFIKDLDNSFATDILDCINIILKANDNYTQYVRVYAAQICDEEADKLYDELKKIECCPNIHKDDEITDYSCWMKMMDETEIIRRL